MSDFNLKKFREEFLQSDGWQVSDCYKPYDDKFLRSDAQDAYEGAKWAWNEQQVIINELQQRIDKALYQVENHGGYDDYTHVIKTLKGDNND